MKKVKSIPRPLLQHARKLTPLELNSLRYKNSFTVLTPELLEQMASRRTASTSTTDSSAAGR